jgi:hypothetical protein
VKSENMADEQKMSYAMTVTDESLEFRMVMFQRQSESG